MTLPLTDVGGLQQRRHHTTARGLSLSCYIYDDDDDDDDDDDQGKN